MGIPAIFLDRDGVLNENRPDYVKNWDEFRFLPGTITALRRLAALQIPIIVITNQAGIGRSIMSSDTVADIHQRMIAEIAWHGGRIDTVLCCPHQIEDQCSCRKPEPGLLYQAASQMNIELSGSVLVGDADTDILAGSRASCRTILVLSGRGREFVRTSGSQRATRHSVAAMPDAITRDLTSAVPVIFRMLRAGSMPLREDHREHDVARSAWLRTPTLSMPED